MTIVESCFWGRKKFKSQVVEEVTINQEHHGYTHTITDDVSLPTNGDEEKKKPGASSSSLKQLLLIKPLNQGEPLIDGIEDVAVVVVV